MPLGVADAECSSAFRSSRRSTWFDGSRLDRMRARRKPDDRIRRHRPRPSIDQRGTGPERAHACARFDDQLCRLQRSARWTDAAADGSSGRSGAQNRVFEIHRHARKRRSGDVHQLEQLRAGLLLGGIDVLIALDDVDVDREFFRARRQRLIARGDLRIALRTQIPDGGRILDQKREIVLRRAAAASSTYRRRSSRACWYRSGRRRGSASDRARIWFCGCPRSGRSIRPAGGEPVRAKIQKLAPSIARAGVRLEQLERIEARTQPGIRRARRHSWA